MTHSTLPFTRLFTMLMILAALIPVGAPTRASSILPQCRFDPDGYFYTKGNPPRGFEDFDYLQLVMARSDRRLESHLNVKNGPSYRFAKLGEFQTHSSGSGITLEFTTEILEGVNYQFSGNLT